MAGDLKQAFLCSDDVQEAYEEKFERKVEVDLPLKDMSITELKALEWAAMKEWTSRLDKAVLKNAEVKKVPSVEKMTLSDQKMEELLEEVSKDLESYSKIKALPKLTGDEDFDSILNQCIDILSVKGKDYTVGTGDRLHNFRTVGEFTGMTPEQTLGVYFYKHISAIFAYIKSGGQSESEPIEGRIADAINYLLLFHKMVQEKKPGPRKG